MSEAAAATPTLVQKLAAEGLGTFVLVFFGCSAALVSGGDYAATGLAFGLAVLVMAYAVGHISGGHFNPAVSVGAAIAGRFAWKDAGIYSAVQVASGIVAAVTLWVISKTYGAEGIAILDGVSNQWDKSDGSFDFVGGFLVEMIATAIFVLVILAVTDLRREGTGVPAPIAIGLGLSLIHFATMGFTGTSVNPARSLGPALFGGGDVLLQQWVFILAPLAGAAVGGFLYPALFGYDRERPVRAPRPARVQPGYAQQGWDPNAQQQWAGGTPEQTAQWQQAAPGQPGQHAQQQWGQPEQPYQQPGQEQQYQQPGQHAQQQPGQPQWGQPDPTQQWQPPAGDEGGTQIRPGQQ